ncbi:MAG TPA: L,D-transpeptidase [Caulobacteraceae bacterium]
MVAIDAPASPTDMNLAGQAIDQALAPASPAQGAYDPGLVRLEVLLDRAGFSPGVIDGHEGDNLSRAVAAYAQGRHLPAGPPDLVQAVLQSLVGQDRTPVMQTYQITPADTAGPFIGTPPKNYRALARLRALSYSNPEQLLAEKFHMDRRLLEALNPGVDFGRPGATILVASPRPVFRRYRASRIEVDKSNDQVRAYGPDGQLAAVYPATVGSVERPAPSGRFAVRSVTRNPDYVYDPRRLTFRVKGARGKLTLRPGPNNPVGTTWIALSYPTYGIHGTPDPSLIGKRASHGCIRLTNWDAAELGRSVRKGVEVDFVGAETIPKTG